MTRHNYTRDVGTPIDKSHPDYGKPQKGTWTAIRGEKANSHVHKVRTHARAVVAAVVAQMAKQWHTDLKDLCSFPKVTFALCLSSKNHQVPHF